jgi:hypothetical protein
MPSDQDPIFRPPTRTPLPAAQRPIADPIARSPGPTQAPGSAGLRRTSGTGGEVVISNRTVVRRP